VPIIDEPLKMAHSYLFALAEESKAKKSREQARDWLKDYILDNCEQDENGNYLYEFPDAITDGTNFIRGLSAQRRKSEYVIDEKARELIYSHQAEDRCLRKVVTYEVDYDELYALNQEGILSDEEIDSILETDVSYAVTKIKL
jgi:hypothetical protein